MGLSSFREQGCKRLAIDHCRQATWLARATARDLKIRATGSGALFTDAGDPDPPDVLMGNIVVHEFTRSMA
jgi:hypothetical protein